MKTTKKLGLVAVCAAMSAGAFFLTPKTPERSSDLALENVEVLGLSAAEAWCAPESDNDCSITIGNVTVSSKGVATTQFN